MSFQKEAALRGFVYQVTDEDGLSKYLKTDKGIAYCGFDPTALSLHVGNLVQIMRLRLFQKMGHTPMVLIGGTTGKIGDPSGRNSERNMLDEETIEKNKNSIKKVFSKFLDPKNTIFVDNKDWLESLGYIDFLRDFGKLFSINKMLSMESVKLRLDREEPLSFLEFNYMVFQAYDFLHLHKEYNCKIQFGGSEQWGNIISGIDLIRRVINATSFGMTSPLITTANGQKMGKSVNGAIWLDPDLLSPYDYWQFWRNTHDNDVCKYLRLFTDMDLKEIEKLEKLEGSEINDAKILLADLATSLAHGDLGDIHEKVNDLFEHGEESSAITLSVCKNITFEDLFLKLDLVKSKGEFKRLVDGSGARCNGVIIKDPKAICDESKLKLSVGKKRHVRVDLVIEN